MTRAILLAAGFGTRLKPLTDTIPKCLVPINGKPILEIWLEQLAQVGVRPILINTHYLSEQVEYYVSSSKFVNDVVLVHEREILGTARTLWENRGFFENEPTLIIHADNYSEVDLSAFLQAHGNRPKSCKLSMVTFRVEDITQCGIVEVNEEGVMTSFVEKPISSRSNLANAAIYCIEPDLVDELEGMVSISDDLLPNLIGRAFTFPSTRTLIDIGTPEAYLRAQASFSQKLTKETFR